MALQPGLGRLLPRRIDSPPLSRSQARRRHAREALNVIENALAASLGKASSKEEQDVAPVTVEALEGVREGLADMVN